MIKWLLGDNIVRYTGDDISSFSNVLYRDGYNEAADWVREFKKSSRYKPKRNFKLCIERYITLLIPISDSPTT